MRGLLFLLVLVLGCGDDDGAAGGGGALTVGEVNGPCFTNGSCNAGLVCNSGTCFSSATGGAVSAGGTEGTGGSVDTGGTQTGGAQDTGGSGAVIGIGGRPATDDCASARTTQECDAVANCHPVFVDSGNFGFAKCATGTTADCVGPATCMQLQPACPNALPVSYWGGCYDGCVRPEDCAPATATP